MKPHIKRIHPVFLILLIALLTSNCAKDSDLYFELAKYEETVPEEENAEESSNQQETEEESPEEISEDESETNEPEPQNSSENFELEEGAYFVSVFGHESNTGLNINHPITLSKAFDIAEAGDVFYVQSGNYGDLYLKLSKSGSENNPIKFIGYKDTPGDLNVSNSSSISYEDYKEQENEVDSNAMPTIFGTNQGRTEYTSSGIWLENSSFIEFKNFQITQKARGILAINSNNIKLNNIVAVNIGSNIENASGRAIHLINVDNAIIENSIVINAGTGGFLLETVTNSIIRDDKVFSDNFVNPLDYYLFFFGESSHNLIQRVHIERINELAHTGHGIGGFQGLTNSVFEDFEIYNTSLELSYASINNNIFRNFKIKGSNDAQKYHYSIQIANGANNNLFENFTIENGNGIQFLEWDRGDTHRTNQYNEINAGRNNTFKNGVITNCNYGIVFHHLERDFAPANDNLFSNMVFRNLNNALFAVNRANYNNKMVDSKLENIPTLFQSKGSSLNFEFSNIEVVNINFDLPN